MTMAPHSSKARLRAVRGAALAFVSAVVFVGFPACNADHAILGGECASGYVACDGRCASALTAPRRCGGCEGTCAAGDACEDGVCVGDDGAASDGSLDGATDDGDTVDASLRDSSVRDGSADDGGTGDGSTGDGGDACPPPPYVTPAACGACGVVCSAPTSACLDDGSGQFVCSLPCTAPLVACHGRCVDTQTDPENCGVCGKFCPSNLCSGGVCQGSTPGDIVVIGHDYQNAASSSSQAKVLTNAVFIPRSDPLRILSYEQFASAVAVDRVKALIDAAALGRTVVFTVRKDAAALTSATLAQNFDVVLLHDQRDGNAATLASMGATWNTSLSTFAKAGGVIVALDGATGQGAMPSLVTAAGLLDLAGHATLAPGSPVSVVAPADRVGTLVVSPYGTYANSASFQSNEPEGSNVVFVARKLVGGNPTDPVVVHKLVP